MNYRMLWYILGLLTAFEGLFMLVPTITAAVYSEQEFWLFAALTLFLVLAGGLATLKKPANRTLFAKDGYVIVALSWILLSVFGALPFYLSRCIPRFIDALFESVSGFTTTGASILHTVENLPRCMLMWRSFTHWVGGMGVLVFIMALLPISGGQTMYIMRAESPGPTVNKLVPRVRTTALLLYLIYIAMTFVEFIMLLFGDMDAFEALTITFGTAGTGGFSVRDSGLAEYSPYSQIVVTVFMILFATNFTSYFLLLHAKWKEAFTTELRVYFALLAAAILLVTIDIRHMFQSTAEALRHAAFTVASLNSSTGYATVNFDLWPTLSKTILVLMMFSGACAGSTGGGVKVSRVVLYCKNMANELHMMIHPRQVRKLKVDGKQVSDEVVRATNAFLIAYILIYMLSMLIISLDHLDLTTNFTAVLATLDNIGPGLELVGPTSNFDVFSTTSKCVLIFDMLAGRLELFPVLMLFMPSTWRK